MSLVTISGLSLAFLGKTLFREISLQVQPRDRLGLVGPNGSGKTTLLRLIAGELSTDKGTVKRAKGARIGYLSQDVRAALSGTVLQSMLDSIHGRLRIRDEIVQGAHALEDIQHKGDQLELAGRLAHLHQVMSYLDNQFPRHEAERILAGLGFQPRDLHAPVASLSEGWKMRAVLASLLYQRPDLLLLDEPTNHLDIPSVRWLEQFLRTYRGALILVCHDREFLNHQINRTISLEPEGMRTYRGNYDSYLEAREQERLTLEAKARNQEQRIKQAQRFIQRFQSKASKARQAQSKIKLLKKMELVESHRPQKTIHFSFPSVARSGREVVTIKGISKAFSNKSLYEDVNLTVRRGERVAIIGPNGSGKTTLLRMIAGEIGPDHGDIILGHQVITSYFAQHHLEMLDQGNTIVEEVTQAAPDETIGFIRNVCGAFLFSGDQVDKPIGILSGGEQARVALAKLLVRPGNLMLMDEPTNHLDLISSEALTGALAEYKGTLLFCSHNQSFVNRLVTKIWDIRGGDIVEYPGNLYEYYNHLERESKIAGTGSEAKAVQAPSAKDKKARKHQRREEAKKRAQIRATLKPIQDRLAMLEGRIAHLERRQRELETILSDPNTYADRDRSISCTNEYREVREALKGLLERWESHHGQLGSAKRSLGV